MNGVPVARHGLIGVRGFPARGYFIPGRDGTWHISRVVHVSARAPFCRFREFPWFMKMFLCKSRHEPIGASVFFTVLRYFFKIVGRRERTKGGKHMYDAHYFPLCSAILSVLAHVGPAISRYFPICSKCIIHMEMPRILNVIIYPSRIRGPYPGESNPGWAHRSEGFPGREPLSPRSLPRVRLPGLNVHCFCLYVLVVQISNFHVSKCSFFFFKVSKTKNYRCSSSYFFHNITKTYFNT